VHGGLRYLQTLDLRRVRESARERATWLAIAPHLVEPLPVLVPAGPGVFPPRFLMAAARITSEFLSPASPRRDRRGAPIPRGRQLSRDACVAAVPEYESLGITGGTLFYDALMYSPERLVLEVLASAGAAGAVVANHLETEAALRR